MASATVGDATTSYGYDGDNQRMFRADNTGMHVTLHGGGGLLLSQFDLIGDGTSWTRDSIYVGSQLLTTVRPATDPLQLSDLLGTWWILGGDQVWRTSSISDDGGGGVWITNEWGDTTHGTWDAGSRTMTAGEEWGWLVNDVTANAQRLLWRNDTTWVRTPTTVPDNLVFEYYHVDALGRVVWDHHVAGLPGYLQILASQGSLVLTDFFAIDAIGGSILERWPSGRAPYLAAFAGDLRVLALRGGALEAHRPDGRVAWTTPVMLSRRTPYDFLLAASSRGVVIVDWKAGSAKSGINITGISIEGRVRWQTTLDNVVDPLTGDIAVVDDVALVVTRSADTDRVVIRTYNAITGAPGWIGQPSTGGRIGGYLICEPRRCLVEGTNADDTDALFALDLTSGTVTLLVKLGGR